MKVRMKTDHHHPFSSGKFNTTAINEVLGFGDVFGSDDFFIHELDVFLESKKKWVDMREAFKNHDLITDNYNTYFFEPKNEEDRKRGYTLL